MQKAGIDPGSTLCVFCNSLIGNEVEVAGSPLVRRQLGGKSFGNFLLTVVFTKTTYILRCLVSSLYCSYTVKWSSVAAENPRSEAAL